MPPAPRLEEVLRNIQEITPEKERGSGHRGKTTTGVGLKPIRFHNILVAYDGSEGARDALSWGSWLAKAHQSRLFVSLVLPPTPEIWSGALTGTSEDTRETVNAVLQDAEVFGRKILQEAQGELHQEGVVCETIMVQGEPKNQLPALVEKHNVDLVVMGSHERRGFDRLALGSVSDAVKDRTDASVLIARNAPPVERVLLPVDGSDHSKRAAAVLVGLMEGSDAQTHVIHVQTWPFAGFTPRGRRMMEDAVSKLKAKVGKHFEDHETNTLYSRLYGKPADRILEEATQEKAGLIVMGARGLSPLKGAFLGSVSNQVVHDAGTSVLLIRSGMRPRARKSERGQTASGTERGLQTHGERHGQPNGPQ